MAREEEAYDIAYNKSLSRIKSIILSFDAAALNDLNDEDEMRDYAFDVLCNFPEMIDDFK